MLHGCTIVRHVLLVGGWYTMLVLLYSYIIILPVVHGRFAATATAAAAADRCSFGLISPLFGCRRGGLVVAGVMLALLCVAAITRLIQLWYVPRVRIYNMPHRSSGVVVLTRVYVASPRHTLPAA